MSIQMFVQHQWKIKESWKKGIDYLGEKHQKFFAINEIVGDSNKITAVNIGALKQLQTKTHYLNFLADSAGHTKVSDMMLVSYNSIFEDDLNIEGLKVGIELIDKTRWDKLNQQTNFKIRDYQQDVIEESIKKYDNNQSKILIEMATGLGKTYTIANLTKRLQEKGFKKVLFVAHQKEILLQSVNSFKNILANNLDVLGKYSFSVCFEGAELANTDFVFSSFQTLKKYTTKKNLINKNQFDLIIVDEAHHAPAPVYSEVINYFSPKLLVGLTATPFRNDGEENAVVNFFGGTQGHINHHNLIWGINNNHLVMPRYYIFNNSQQIQGNQIFENRDTNIDAINQIKKFIQQKSITNTKCIVFCRNIKHIEDVLPLFHEAFGNSSDKLLATSVHSGMLAIERQRNIEYFKNNNACQFILVRDLFNEGIDIPETNMIVFMRCTGSRTVWLQQLGRGLRKYPNKEFLYVLDFVNSTEHITEIKDIKRKLDELNEDGVPRMTLDEIVVPPTKFTSGIDTPINELLIPVMIEWFENYLETHGRLPKIEDLEAALPDIYDNVDDISTVKENFVFDEVAKAFPEMSYHGIIQKHFPEFYEKQKPIFENTIVCDAENIFVRNGKIPTYEEISEESKYGLLLNYKPDEAEILVNKSQLESSIKNDKLQDKIRVFSKYSYIKTLNDLRNLNADQVEEIKVVFKSIVVFFNQLNGIN